MRHRTLFFSISMILLVFTAILVYMRANPRQFPYGLVLWAEELSAKPDQYIVVTDPDPYLLEALSNPETEVRVGNWENTDFDELVGAYGTNNVEYNGAYYTVDLQSVEPGWTVFFWILGLSWIGLGVGFVISCRRP